MITHDTEVRIRYGEVDMMGFLYHSHYVELFDVGRTELMRAFGFPYAEIERSGVMMPVVSVHINYKNPAHYDDLLTIRTMLRELPKGVKVTFDYEVFRDGGSELITTGYVTLAFMNSDSHRPVRPPESLRELWKSHF